MSSNAAALPVEQEAPSRGDGAATEASYSTGAASPSLPTETAAPISRIGSSCLSLVLQWLQARSELPQAARVSQEWHATACHPATWRTSDPFEMSCTEKGYPQVQVRAQQLFISRCEHLLAAASSRLYCNVAHLDYQSGLAQLTAADCAALPRFRCIRSLRLGVSDWYSGLLAGLLQTPALQHLQYLNTAWLSDDLIPPSSLEHLVVHTRETNALTPLVTRMAQLTHLKTISPPTMKDCIEWSMQLREAGMPLGHPLTILCRQGIPGASPAAPAYWIRSVALDGFRGEADFWEQQVMRHFPHVDRLTLHIPVLEPGQTFLHGKSTPLTKRESACVWAKPDAPVSAVHVLRFMLLRKMQGSVLPSETREEATRMATSWLRQSGSIFSGLRTLLIPARGAHQLGWTAEFQRMPLLTDITMDELLLTDAICADFSHLPLLRRLRGVRWPIDIDPPDSHERMTTNDPRAKHFPSLVSLHITSEAMVESRLWTPSTMKKRACGRRFQGVFPHYDLYQFVRSLPKKLEELDIRLGTAWSFDLTTIRCCLDTLVAREPEERRLDEQYLAILQRMSARTDIADGIRTRSDGVRVPMQEPYQPAEFTREERWQSITAMEVYQDRSFEELRLVDYDRHADILSGEVPLFPDPNRDVGPPAWRPAELGDLLEKWIEARDRSRQVHQPWERPLR